MFNSVRWSSSTLLRTCISSSTCITLPRARTFATRLVTDNKTTTSDQDALSRSTTLFKTYKPVTPGLRHLRRPLNEHLYEGRPVRLLTIARRKKGGRNSHGHITVRHRGGGHKQRIRTVDFLRSEPGVYEVVRIEYDPGRSAHIALVKSQNKEHTGTSRWKYIIATEGLRAGDQVQSFRQGIPVGFNPIYDALREEEAKRKVERAEAKARRAEAKAKREEARRREEETLAQVETETINLEGQPKLDADTSVNPLLGNSTEHSVVESQITKDKIRAKEKKNEDEDEDEAEEGSSSSEMLALGILRTATLKSGNVLPLSLIPPGTVVHSISLKPNGPGILVRSAGSFGQVVTHEEAGRYTHVKLQSGEVRKVLSNCCATVGRVSNPLWKNRILGKAGRARWLGRRPSVRGVAMNANDHPHGGGRGKSKSNKHPVSIWGWGTKGTRTRKPGPKGPKNSNKMVIQERPRGKDKRGKL